MGYKRYVFDYGGTSKNTPAMGFGSLFLFNEGFSDDEFLDVPNPIIQNNHTKKTILDSNIIKLTKNNHYHFDLVHKDDYLANINYNDFNQ